MVTNVATMWHAGLFRTGGPLTNVKHRDTDYGDENENVYTQLG